MIQKLMPIREILTNLSAFQWNEALYLPASDIWTLETQGAVLDIDLIDGDADLPAFAIENRLEYVLGVNDLKQVEENLRQQKPKCVLPDLFNAFLFYHKNDAFIEIDQGQ